MKYESNFNNASGGVLGVCGVVGVCDLFHILNKIVKLFHVKQFAQKVNNQN